MNFVELNDEELYLVDAGSVWKYIGGAGAVIFGAAEVYSGIAAGDGVKNIVGGGAVLVGGIYALIS